jgi:hypothetical protein
MNYIPSKGDWVNCFSLSGNPLAYIAVKVIEVDLSGRKFKGWAVPGLDREGCQIDTEKCEKTFAEIAGKIENQELIRKLEGCLEKQRGGRKDF